MSSRSDKGHDFAQTILKSALTKGVDLNDPEIINAIPKIAFNLVDAMEKEYNRRYLRGRIPLTPFG